MASVAESPTCLIVDDEPRLRQVLVHLMRADGFQCLEAGNGVEALEVLGREAVTLVMTDMQMPKMNGTDLLREVRRRHPDVAVVMITGNAEVEIAVGALSIGAMDYIVKPFQLEEVRARVAQALEKRRLILENRDYQERLEQRVTAQQRRLEELFVAGIQSLSEALEAKDPYTHGHSVRVASYSSCVARELGVSAELIRQIELGGHVHDIGKIGVREEVLNKTGPLTPAEYEHIMLHPVIGWRILAPLLGDTPHALNVVRWHHERLTPPTSVPDRPLRPPAEIPTVAVRAPGYHPFVYRKMVLGPVGSFRPTDGDLVRVVDRDHLPLGFGLWNSRSQITLRLLSRGVNPPDEVFWADKVAAALKLRRETLDLDAVSTAYRVLHAEADGISGLLVDRYDDVLSVEIFSLGIYQRIGPLLELLSAAAGTKHFRVQVDERIAMAEDFPGRPVVSPGLPPRVTVVENKARFRVQFEGSHKTGFFCDQRENRLRLAGFCRDRSVLDVCCYTGAFGVHALLNGKARDVTGVDLDEKAIAVARDNANANNLRTTLVHADAFGYMRQMNLNGRSFGVVVLDPPKLIPGRLDIAAGKRKYFDLNVLAMGLVETGGTLLTCSCSGLLPAEEFVILLRAAARKAGRAAQILAITGAAQDHPVGLEALEGSYLKAVWLRIGDRVAPPPGPSSDDYIEVPEDEPLGDESARTG